MALRIGINGFGRIGRNILRASWDRDDLEIVHVNDLADDAVLAHLLQYDTIFGTWKQVEARDGALFIDGTRIGSTDERDPAALPWASAGVDIVLECTGVFRDADKAKAHLEAGASKVIISAPGKNVDGTFVLGVNDDQLTGDERIISNASCTTNCLAPLAKVLHETVGIEHGLITTIHSYTTSQNLLDGPHKDLRRARAAAVNIVPTTTGAARAIGLVYPELDGKLDGMAVRVPTPNGSITDLVFTAGRDTSAEEINEALEEAAAGPLKGILEARHDELVSSDIIGNPHSSIADLGLTKVIGDRQVKVLSWYDNEWGFSNRMIDMAAKLGGVS